VFGVSGRPESVSLGMEKMASPKLLISQ